MVAGFVLKGASIVLAITPCKRFMSGVSHESGEWSDSIV